MRLEAAGKPRKHPRPPGGPYPATARDTANPPSLWGLSPGGAGREDGSVIPRTSRHHSRKSHYFDRNRHNLVIFSALYSGRKLGPFHRDHRIASSRMRSERANVAPASIALPTEISPASTPLVSDCISSASSHGKEIDPATTDLARLPKLADLSPGCVGRQEGSPRRNTHRSAVRAF